VKFLLVFVRVSQDQDGQLLALSDAYAAIDAELHIRVAEWKATKSKGKSNRKQSSGRSPLSWE